MGEELLQFCEQERLLVAGTFTRQEHKATWFHNRWGTAHTLDHFLVRSMDRRWVRSVKAVHFAASRFLAQAGTTAQVFLGTVVGAH